MSNDSVAGIMAELRAPFPAEKIKFRAADRSRKGQVDLLAYIDARDVAERLDEVLGADKWREKTMQPVMEDGRMSGIIHTLELFIGDTWVSRSDVGSASSLEALKGAASDAFKRAAVKFGIGAYLYDMPKTRVPVEALDEFGQPPELPEIPDWALTSEELAIRIAEREAQAKAGAEAQPEAKKADLEAKDSSKTQEALKEKKRGPKPRKMPEQPSSAGARVFEAKKDPESAAWSAVEFRAFEDAVLAVMTQYPTAESIVEPLTQLDSAVRAELHPIAKKRMDGELDVCSVLGLIKQSKQGSIQEKALVAAWVMLRFPGEYELAQAN